MVNNPAPAPAPAGFANKIRQNSAPAGFEKNKSGTTLMTILTSFARYYCICVHCCHCGVEGIQLLDICAM